MNHLDKLVRQLFVRLTILILAGSFYSLFLWAIIGSLELGATIKLVIMVVGIVAFALLAAMFGTKSISEPLTFIWRVVLNLGDHATTPPPNLETIKFGRELVTGLAGQIYRLATAPSSSGLPNSKPTTDLNLPGNFPLPIICTDKDLKISFANDLAAKYVGIDAKQLIGQSLYTALDLSFSNEETFNKWYDSCKDNKISDQSSWERVRLKLPSDKGIKQLDIAASYNKDNPGGVETVIILFDHSDTYGRDDQSLGFIALAVHELRTPLTALRGYIEVFQDELGKNLDPELTDFMQKMQASAENLSAFVGNILNVARIEGNQLVLRLREENWETILMRAVEDMRLRASTHKKTIELTIVPGLPTVAADRVSVIEVVYNLLDNAIKYSKPGPAKIIVNASLNQEGRVETTVQDFGVGLPDSVTPNLFEKFYRNHRTRAQIGGTGLGLYLSKAIISAHDGNIWVRSKEGEGTVIGFTLLPYKELAADRKAGDNKEIVREAHGWIKNHSMFRR